MNKLSHRAARSTLALTLLMTSSLAIAQEGGEGRGPMRTRVALGPQLVPSFPGSDDFNVAPLIGVSRARGDKDFAFSAPDDSFGISIINTDAWQAGPTFAFEGKRSRGDTNNLLPEVKFTPEAGGFVQFALTPAFRLRAEARAGIGGHKGVVGTLGADYVARDHDRWLVSFGPRATFANARYERAYFGVGTGVPGLAAFRPDGGLQAVGAAASFRRELSRRVGVFAYAKYDRLVSDAGRSPVVRVIGTRDQFSGGVALAYTFGGKSN